MKHRPFFLGLFLLGLFCVDSHAANTRALLIGISQYSELEGLRYADADVKAFSQVLTDFGGYRKSDVTVVLNTEATKARIMAEIEKVVRASKREPLDHFILMFAGHGMPGRMEGGRGGSAAGAVDTNIFLAPSDASTAASSFFSTGKEIGNETFINRAWLAKQLSEIEAKSVVIILDSCYSGTEAFGELFFENLGYSIRSFEYSGPQRGVRDVQKRNLDIRQASTPGGQKRIAYFASSREDQPSAEYDELRHGALSYCLFENIKRAQQEIYDSETRQLSVDSVYSSITALFHETKVKGRSLEEFHQPVLLPIPDFAGVKDMPFITVRGVKRKEIETGVLEILTDPPGLQIFVDGMKRPETTNARLALQDGKHLIELYMPSTGYRHTFTADISPLRPVTETISMRGILEVASYWLRNGQKSAGPLLEVYLDGTAFGKSGTRVDNLLAGSHTLEVRFEKVSKSRRIEIRPDSPLTVNYSVIREAAKPAPRNDRGVGNVVF